MSEEQAPYNPSAFPQPMIEHPNGGIAFPSHFGELEGMSLRDWFAGQALAGLMANSAIVDTDGKGVPTWMSGYAYRLADAMLKERTKKQ